MSTWNPTDLAAGNITLSNANLTATSSGGQVIGVAVDLVNNKLWYWSPANARWNGAAIGTQNPATNTGGLDISYITGAKFPGWTGYNATGGDVCNANFGASAFQNPPPSGFSSWNALAGTTTWNPSDKSANITLSNGNLTATAVTTTSTWRSCRATTSLTTGKAYFELQAATVDSSNGWMGGVANATASLAGFVGSDLNGIGYQSQGTVYKNGSSLSTIDAFSATTFWRAVRGSGSQGSGKLYLEVTASAVDGVNGFAFGLANASFTLVTYYAGQDNNACGFQQSGNYWLNAVKIVPDGGGYAVGATAALAVDLGAQKLWFYSPATGLWNSGAIGAQNPATGVGGIAIGVLGLPLYPVFSGYSSGTDTAILNVGGASFVNTVPSGFSAWDVGGTTGPAAQAAYAMVMA